MKATELLLIAFLFQSAISAFVVVKPEDIPYLQNIPGLEFIGSGYDGRYVLWKEAVRLPFINFQFNQTTYFHPLLTSRVYRVPEEVITRTISYSEANAHIYETIDEYKDRMAWEFGIQVQQDDSTIVAKVIDICNKVKDGTCNLGITNAKQLSISPKITFIKDFLSTRDFYAIESREFTQLYALHLFPENITAGAQLELNKLVGKNFTQNVDAFMRFIELYGTHYVDYAVLGGEVSMVRCVKKEYNQTVGNLTITVNLTAGEALAEANMDFKAQINPNLGVGYESTKQESQLDSTTSWTLTGGDSGKSNLLDSSVTREAVKVWKDTIPTNPAPIRYRLKKITSLISDVHLKAELELAIAVYMNFDTIDIISIQPKFE